MNILFRQGYRIALFALLLCSPVIAGQKTPYNIILILNDQEAYQLAKAENYELAARQTLAQHGIRFEHHYTAAAMCSPSRASLLTGVPPQVHGVFDQMEYSYVPNLDPKRPNMGSILKKLGYQTAYFGKFEMNKSLLADKNDVNYSQLAQSYGFDVFNADGDVGGTPQQGYHEDNYFVGEAVRYLREITSHPQGEQKPFFMVVSLLNPHDIMYGDANLQGLVPVQNPAVKAILPPPDNSIYAKKWKFPLSKTLQESLTVTGMPPALLEYQKGWSGALGYIPTDRKDMWQYYYNYYLNAIRDNDNALQQLVSNLNELKLWDNTIVILTADHGEMGGSHGGLRGKGPFVYEENSHIPLIIAHPDAPKNLSCPALTSHLDILPTLIGFANPSAALKIEASQGLVGYDFSNLLTETAKCELHSIRPAILFNYIGISTIDSSYLLKTLIAALGNQPPLPPLTEVNISKRGFLAFIFDGTFKFGRYYAPKAMNRPHTLEELFKYNDVQLFNLLQDPQEKTNLALDIKVNSTILSSMNNLLNELMQKEVGEAHSFLPAEVHAQTVSEKN